MNGRSWAFWNPQRKEAAVPGEDGGLKFNRGKGIHPRNIGPAGGSAVLGKDRRKPAFENHSGVGGDGGRTGEGSEPWVIFNRCFADERRVMHGRRQQAEPTATISRLIVTTPYLQDFSINKKLVTAPSDFLAAPAGL